LGEELANSEFVRKSEKERSRSLRQGIIEKRIAAVAEEAVAVTNALGDDYNLKSVVINPILHCHHNYLRPAPTSKSNPTPSP
jgi:hypothetical protein